MNGDDRRRDMARLWNEVMVAQREWIALCWEPGDYRKDWSPVIERFAQALIDWHDFIERLQEEHRDVHGSLDQGGSLVGARIFHGED